MRDIKDIIGKKIAVQCETREQLELMCELIGANWTLSDAWRVYGAKIAIDLFKFKDFGAVNDYEKEGYTILPATDFIESEPAVDVIYLLNKTLGYADAIHLCADGATKELAANIINTTQIILKQLKNR